MQRIKPNFGKQYQPPNLKGCTAATSLTDVYVNHYLGIIDGFKLFTAHYQTIPNFYRESEINCTKAAKWLEDYAGNEIKDVYFDNLITKSKSRNTYGNAFYVLDNGLIVNFDFEWHYAKLYFRGYCYKKIEHIILSIQQFPLRQKKIPEISLLTNLTGNFDTKVFQLKKPKLKIADNYNDDFLSIHDIIFKRLSKQNDKGLVLLHGKPGTGKTSYIRFLCTSLRKKVIFLPPDLASAITDPAFISVLTENANSIFVIEDAERVITDRQSNGKSPVSALLNITDGLLADCLNIQVVCSFNTDVGNIDSALLRKGRLIAKYEFKELETTKAQMLSNKLGFATHITQPMTLTSIYNQAEKEFSQKISRTPIGFQINQ